MRFALAISLLTTLPVLLNGQGIYFNNIYDFNGASETSWGVVPIDSGYVIYGAGWDTPDSFPIAAQIIDLNGNLIKQETYFSYPSEYYYPGWQSALIKTSDGGFAAVGTRQAGNDNSLFFIKLNAAIDTEWVQFYIDTNILEVGGSVKETPDKGYVFTGQSTETDTNGAVVLVKTDSLGNVQWKQFYGGISSDWGISVDLAYDGGYIIGGCTQSYGAGETDMYIVKTDSAGNFQWDKTYGGVETDYDCYTISTSDKGYATCGINAKYDAFGHTFANGFIAKMDSLGTEEWTQEYGDTSPMEFRVIIELQDGSLVVAGSVDPDSTALDDIVGVMLKVDSVGNEIWHRAYKYTTAFQSQNYFRDIKATDDGGFIATGFSIIADTMGFFQDMWVGKTDSLGCPFEGCDTISGVIEIGTLTRLSIKVYPNPARERFTIVGNYALPAVLEIYDMTGRKVKEVTGVMHQVTVDVQGWNRGIYLYRLIDSGGGTVSGKVVVE